MDITFSTNNFEAYRRSSDDFYIYRQNSIDFGFGGGGVDGWLRQRRQARQRTSSGIVGSQ
jgi:hypothetical protein